MAKNIALPRAIIIPRHADGNGAWVSGDRPGSGGHGAHPSDWRIAIGAINMATEHVPVLPFSGRRRPWSRAPGARP
jgi:hypothetical protein